MRILAHALTHSTLATTSYKKACRSLHSTASDAIPVMVNPALGIPGGVYKYFTELLETENPQLKCKPTLDYYGDNGRSEVKVEDWGVMAEEVIAQVEKVVYADKTNPRPVIGLGHSFGGCAHKIAAFKRPDLYRGVIMIDSPMFNPVSRTGMVSLKALGKLDQVIPARAATVRRRSVFSSMEEVRSRLTGRGIYRKWHPECFEAFLRTGFVQNPDGTVRLLGPVANEISIYDSSPADIGLTTTGLYTDTDTPMAYIYAHNPEDRLIFGPDVLYLRNKLRHTSVVPMPDHGGHMWPLDHPEEAAKYISSLMVDIGIVPAPVLERPVPEQTVECC
ncbi:hypothetical protein SARC_04129 [Sphaeroforma arctica JP610]|uniref:AB hydrolase-1 domain-containing protein n=1 Tax=Sphaeroforma arctica JP610 TaxID=667725 RepID=A0A0L0G3K7_9EUKA|nr:hypothetical protein SARC_04129 [Sphaeroforma arctica JP610]KNC83630.1 hypothetical protein SARC_04129 [Sphaeroforma arctica JP610]|eukprot:XP_014157532.1 hypothetical protein SARC_04129 [Sphaeroforma arctica JP610]